MPGYLNFSSCEIPGCFIRFPAKKPLEGGSTKYCYIWRKYYHLKKMYQSALHWFYFSYTGMSFRETHSYRNTFICTTKCRKEVKDHLVKMLNLKCYYWASAFLVFILFYFTLHIMPLKKDLIKKKDYFVEWIILRSSSSEMLREGVLILEEMMLRMRFNIKRVLREVRRIRKFQIGKKFISVNTFEGKNTSNIITHKSNSRTRRITFDHDFLEDSRG